MRAEGTTRKPDITIQGTTYQLTSHPSPLVAKFVSYGSLIFPAGPPNPGGMPSGMTIEELDWRRIS